MSDQYTWDLTYFYKDEASFEADLEAFKELAKKAGSYQGKLSDESQLLEYLRLE